MYLRVLGLIYRLEGSTASQQTTPAHESNISILPHLYFYLLELGSEPRSSVLILISIGICVNM